MLYICSVYGILTILRVRYLGYKIILLRTVSETQNLFPKVTVC